jgi:6-phospho-beta-glucosidase
MKLAIIGAGSTYTPEIIEGLILNLNKLPLTELALMDLDSERLQILGDLTLRMLKTAEVRIKLTLSQNLSQALEDSAFVITQIRVGGSAARLNDEKAAAAAGLLAQETTGAAGFLKAVRTVPVMLEIASVLEKICPQAWLLNFTNPVSLITQALVRHSKVKILGLCNVPITMRKIFARLLHLPDEELELKYMGLNHLSWVLDVLCRGKSLKSELMRRWRAQSKMPFPKSFLKGLGLFPSPYLRYYYFTPQVLEQQRSKGLRALEVQKIEAKLLQLYRSPRMRHKPALLARRGGSFYSTAAVQLMTDLAQGKNCSKTLPIINLPVSYPGFKADTVMELPVKIVQGKLIPQAAELGKAELELMQSVKAYEELTIKAVLEKSAAQALQALMLHPLVGDYAKAKAILKKVKF